MDEEARHELENMGINLRGRRGLLEPLMSRTLNPPAALMSGALKLPDFRIVGQ